MEEELKGGGTPPLQCELSCKCTAALNESVLMDMVTFAENISPEIKTRLANKVSAGLIGSPEALLFEMRRLRLKEGKAEDV